jgi:hypothetical protein
LSSAFGSGLGRLAFQILYLVHAMKIFPTRVAIPETVLRAIAAFLPGLSNDEEGVSPGLLLDVADCMGSMDVDTDDVVAALEETAIEDEAHWARLDSPNPVEY